MVSEGKCAARPESFASETGATSVIPSLEGSLEVGGKGKNDGHITSEKC